MGMIKTKNLIAALTFIHAGSIYAWTLGNSTLQTQRGWQTNEVSFDINHLQCGITEAEMNAAVDTAAALLSSIPNSNLVVKRGNAVSLVITESNPPVIWCDSGYSTSPNFVSGNTQFTAQNSTGYITQAMIRLNSNPAGSARIEAMLDVSANRLALLIAHEMGHALGLGHSSFAPALMHYSIGSKDNLTLSQDDIDGFAFLYPRKEFGDGIYGCASIRQVGGGSPPDDPTRGLMTTTLWFFVFSAITLFMRRPHGSLASKKLR